MNLYDFEVASRQGQVKLSDYRGKVALVVNSATGCGFTPQYEDLQKLYEKLKDRGFVVLDFPCDQFGHQAPGSDDEIANFCTAKFKVAYPQFRKIEVNGPGAIPLYAWLREQVPFEGLDPKHKFYDVLCDVISKGDPDWQHNNNIKWNFTKFLVNREGQVVRRFEPTTDIAVVEEAVTKLL